MTEPLVETVRTVQIDRMEIEHAILRAVRSKHIEFGEADVTSLLFEYDSDGEAKQCTVTARKAIKP